MSRRALSDNSDRAGFGSGGEATADDGRFFASIMSQAIELALATQPHPNPRVGAIVVADGEIVGRGAHVRAGGDHAEVFALRQAGDRARGGTLVVTLEPCSHHGRTPPCTESVIDAGISRVVVGAIDPDSRVSGSGVKELKDAGIDVATGILDDDVEAADRGYFHHRRTGLPFVTLKLASTLDAQIAAADRTSKWISGEEARIDGHRLRADSDIVLVGAGTVLDDDPRLDVRLPDYEGRQPRPVIVAGSRELPAESALFGRDPLVFTAGQASSVGESVALGSGGRVDLAGMLADLGERGYVSALVEGGATLATAMVRGGHVNRIVFYLAAKLGLGLGLPAFAGEFATVTDALPVHIEDVARVGVDLRVEVKVGV